MEIKPIPKPGPKKKKSKIMNRKTRIHDIDKPKEKNCRRCGVETGTERYAHYEGFRKHEFGKGTGIKVNDMISAWLCQKCTDIMDEKPGKTSHDIYLKEVEHSEEWLYLICKTHLL